MKWLVARAAVLLLCSTAEAKGKVEAKEAFARATRFYNLSDFQHALDAFKEAYLDYPDASDPLQHRAVPASARAEARCGCSRSSRTCASSRASPKRDEVVSRIDVLEKQVQEEDEAERARRERAEADARAATAAMVTPPAVVVVAPPPPQPKPVYKKWWFWTAIGGAAVAVGLGVGLGIGLRETQPRIRPARSATAR